MINEDEKLELELWKNWIEQINKFNNKKENENVIYIDFKEVA